MPADTIAKQEENQRVMRDPEASFDAPFSSIQKGKDWSIR